MRTQTSWKPLALALALGGSAASWAAPVTPQSLKPCTLTQAEVEAVFGLTLDRAEPSDMTFATGRDVGCLYTFKDSTFELTVRQTLDTSAPAAAQIAPSEGAKALPSDPDRATWKAAPADRPGAGGELAYARGRVQTRVRVRGGRLTGAQVLQRILLLRRVP